ncbi:MAG TPA: hypothetical protein PK294_04725 [Ignavibacteria bacterium]|nr:hypothetical protein [Ignavibacteria bacterium]HQY51347.1 hypothetical protein [Ignavibacteria bacterium]HRA99726.1 hypothetical protein [Ignavibacteria bacterium]
MIKIFFTLFIVLLSSNLYSQDTHWTNLAFYYSNGTVSPDYQYSYQILLNENGEGMVNYKNSEGNKERNFNVSSEDLENFNEYFKGSDVFKVDPDKMRSLDPKDGGSVRTLEVTLYQSPELDAMPPIIRIPEYLNKKYTEDMKCVYDRIESLVPEEIYTELKIKN